MSGRPAQCYIPAGAAIMAGFIMKDLSERDQPRHVRPVTGGRPGSSPAPSTFTPLDGPWAGEGEDRPACEQAAPDTFFPDPRDHKRAAEAKRLCALCPRREACLNDALERPDEWAVRGGYTAAERKARFGR